MEIELYRYQSEELKSREGVEQLLLYPAVLHLDESGGNARVVIATPPKLSWGTLWLCIGVSLATLSETYRTFAEMIRQPDALETRTGSLGPFYRNSGGNVVFVGSNTYVKRGEDP